LQPASKGESALSTVTPGVVLAGSAAAACSADAAAPNDAEGAAADTEGAGSADDSLRVADEVGTARRADRAADVAESPDLAPRGPGCDGSGVQANSDRVNERPWTKAALLRSARGMSEP